MREEDPKPPMLTSQRSTFVAPAAPAEKEKKEALRKTITIPSITNENSTFLKLPTTVSTISMSTVKPAEDKTKIKPPKVEVTIPPKPTPDVTQNSEKGANSLKSAMIAQGVG